MTHIYLRSGNAVHLEEIEIISVTYILNIFIYRAKCLCCIDGIDFLILQFILKGTQKCSWAPTFLKRPLFYLNMFHIKLLKKSVLINCRRSNWHCFTFTYYITYNGLTHSFLKTEIEKLESRRYSIYLPHIPCKQPLACSQQSNLRVATKINFQQCN